MIGIHAEMCIWGETVRILTAGYVGSLLSKHTGDSPSGLAVILSLSKFHKAFLFPRYFV